MSDHSKDFWENATEERKELVRNIDRNFYYDHPEYVTTRRLVPDCLGEDSWMATAVKYPSVRKF